MNRPTFLKSLFALPSILIMPKRKKVEWKHHDTKTVSTLGNTVYLLVDEKWTAQYHKIPLIVMRIEDFPMFENPVYEWRFDGGPIIIVGVELTLEAAQQRAVQVAEALSR